MNLESFFFFLTLLGFTYLYIEHLLMFLLLQSVAGLAADGRQIVARAKSEATNYERFLFSRISICYYFCAFLFLS